MVSILSKLLGSTLFRYGIGALVALVIAWFSTSYITSTLNKAKNYDILKTEIKELRESHKTEIEELISKHEFVLKQKTQNEQIAKANTEAANEQIKQWQRRYYAESVKASNLSQATKDWGNQPYPLELK